MTTQRQQAVHQITRDMNTAYMRETMYPRSSAAARVLLCATHWSRAFSNGTTSPSDLIVYLYTHRGLICGRHAHLLKGVLLQHINSDEAQVRRLIGLCPALQLRRRHASPSGEDMSPEPVSHEELLHAIKANRPEVIEAPNWELRFS